jgi:hypothetical protein
MREQIWGREAAIHKNGGGPFAGADVDLKVDRYKGRGTEKASTLAWWNNVGGRRLGESEAAQVLGNFRMIAFLRVG